MAEPLLVAPYWCLVGKDVKGDCRCALGMKRTADEVTMLLISLAAAAGGYGSDWGRRHQRHATTAELYADLRARRRLQMGKEASVACRRLQA
uniref:Uncharacterized protein n=1 Tax=Setaria viridis TaxID=4556 RepID=A0A4U6U9B0_SETVI|nr:hypothetical protein SEVIR_5G034000v2 [Setaria viridis]